MKFLSFHMTAFSVHYGSWPEKCSLHVTKWATALVVVTVWVTTAIRIVA